MDYLLHLRIEGLWSRQDWDNLASFENQLWSRQDWDNLASFRNQLWSRQESNLDLVFRKHLFYPLNYGTIESLGSEA